MNSLLAKLRRPLGFVVATAAAAFITATVTVWVNSRAVSEPPAPEREPALLTVAQYSFSENDELWVVPGELSSEAGARIDELTRYDDWLEEGNREEFHKILEQHEGVRVESYFDEFGPTVQYSPVELVVTGNHDSAVVIREVKAEVLEREAPLAGTLFYGPPEGLENVIDLGLDLDASESVANRVNEDIIESGEQAEPFFAEKFVTLKRGESTRFRIVAYTRECYCEWEIVIDAVVDGANESFTVRDESGPFRTTAFAPTYATAYSTGSENPQGRIFGPMPAGWSPLAEQ